MAVLEWQEDRHFYVIASSAGRPDLDDLRRIAEWLDALDRQAWLRRIASQ